jgi:hypothetical protein
VRKVSVQRRLRAKHLIGLVQAKQRLLRRPTIDGENKLRRRRRRQ